MLGRRKFLSTLIGGVAATGAVRSWPFRIFSFPNDVHIGFGLWRSEAERLMRVDSLDLSLWGRNLTPAEVNSADFGFAVSEDCGLMVMPAIPKEVLELVHYQHIYSVMSHDRVKRAAFFGDFGFYVPPDAKILDVQASRRNPS